MLRRTLLLAGAAGVAGCGVVARQAEPSTGARLPDQAIAFRSARGITPQLQWARTAWRYVENNTEGATGLVNGVDRSPVLTTWNLADALAATVAARELRILDAREFDQRMSKLLGFIATMDLSGGALPNKAYHAQTGKMVGYDGRPNDIGWSAIDIGRLLLWLRIVGERHPQFDEYADKAVLRWTFCDVIDDCGRLHGTARNGGQVQRYPEGRLGYEQLAGAGFAAWGFEARRSVGLPPLATFNIHGIPLRHDARDPRTTGAQAPVLTMPFALLGMELGWKHPSAAALEPLADTVFRVQEARWQRERILTARSDYQLPTAPYVVLDSVFASGYAFNTIAPDGAEHEKLALLSTRAAFAMAALWPGDYAERLVDGVKWLYDPDRGWYEGRFETGAPQPHLTLSTNAAVLESLLFRAQGPLLPATSRAGPFHLQTADPFLRMNRCWPRERAACAG